MKLGPTLVQGYNTQAAVTEDQIVVAAEVIRDANGPRRFRPMLARAQENLVAAGTSRRIGTLLADAGYRTDREIASLLEEPTTPRLLVATEDHPAHRTRWSPSARLRARMRQRLTSSTGQALYARRPRICDPVLGGIKWTRGTRRLLRRRLGACDEEWELLTRVPPFLSTATSNMIVPSLTDRRLGDGSPSSSLRARCRSGAPSLAADPSMGHPPETASLACAVACAVAGAVGPSATERRAAFFTTMPRFVGCTASGYEAAGKPMPLVGPDRPRVHRGAWDGDGVPSKLTGERIALIRSHRRADHQG